MIAALLLGLTACAGLKEFKPETGPAAAIVTKEIYQPKPGKPNEGSLWPGDTSRNLLFGDTKASQVGDVVNVTLEENFTSSATATTQTSKSSNLNLQTGQLLG
ncbi:MAG: flagellar basal body L-ring protein FlgH, partial [Nitrospinaceae bacterium]